MSTQSIPRTNRGGPRFRAASGWNIVAGIWVIVSPRIFGIEGPSGAMVNNVIFGILTALLAGVRFAGVRSPQASWLNCLIGLWIIASAWVYPSARGDTPFQWNEIIIGLIVVALALVSIARDRQR